MGSILDLLFDPAKKQRPRRTGIYGPEGIGKTELASNWLGPVAFLPTEDGLRNLTPGIAFAFPQIMELGDLRSGTRTGNGLSFAELIAGLASAATLPFKTLALDTVDGLHSLVESHNKIIYTDQERSYGKDVGLLAATWRQVLNALEWLNINKGVEILLLSHYQISKFNDPLGESYNYYSPRLPESCAALVREWCDEFFFFNYHTVVIQKEAGFNKSRNVAMPGSDSEGCDRSLFTTRKPGYHAKHRINGLPDEIGVRKGAKYHELIGRHLAPAASEQVPLAVVG